MINTFIKNIKDLLEEIYALIVFLCQFGVNYYKKTVEPLLSSWNLNNRKGAIIIASGIVISSLVAGVSGFAFSNMSPAEKKKFNQARLASDVPKPPTSEKYSIRTLKDIMPRDGGKTTDIRSSEKFSVIEKKAVSGNPDRSNVTESAAIASDVIKVSLLGNANTLRVIDTKVTEENTEKDQRRGWQYAGKNALGKLRLVFNKSETLELDMPYKTALIGNETIADVVPLSDTLIYILGKKIGTTRLTVLDKSQSIKKIIEIEVTHDLASIAKELKTMLPDSDIKVRSLNGSVLLTGTVPDAMTLKRAITFAEKFTAGDITNGLSIDAPQQVMLEVRFLEANKEAAKEIGISWNILANKFIGATLLANPSTSISNIEGIANGLVSGKLPFGTAVASILNKGTSVDLMIQALENRNVARRLAEPNLVALSGDKASFLAGGEFPFSVIGPNQTVGTQFRKYGISLQFTPTVLDNNLINLKIEPEVSELGPSLVELADGVKVPSLLVRRVKTTVELRDGQSFAIAGLLQSTDYKIKRQLPWIGDIPILGALFRSSAFQRKETDLVIIITPRLVQPAAPRQKLRTPLDDTLASNDVEFFLMGKDEVLIRTKQQQSQVGHMLKHKSVSSGNKKSGQGTSGHNAVTTNKAIQTVNPWPDHSNKVDFPADGVRSLRTMEKYYGSSSTNKPSQNNQLKNHSQ